MLQSGLFAVGQGSKAFHLFVCSFLYLCLLLSLPVSFDVKSEQVITEREMALAVDAIAMNPLPLKKEFKSRKPPNAMLLKLGF